MFIHHERFVSFDSRFFVGYKVTRPACNNDSRRCAIQQWGIQVNFVFSTTFKNDVTKWHGINFFDRNLGTKKSHSHSLPPPFNKFPRRLFFDTNLRVLNHILINDTTHRYLPLFIVWICFKDMLCFHYQVNMWPLHSRYRASLQISFLITNQTHYLSKFILS
jgi:hypothetical protein